VKNSGEPWPADLWVERLSKGETLREIGASVGITGERVRQVVTAYAPHKPWKDSPTLAQTRKARKPCRVCGGPVGPHCSSYCSPEHREGWRLLRYHFDPDHRQAMRVSTAKSNLKHGREKGNEQKMLEAEGRSLIPDRRWLVRGSKSYLLAQEAYENEWPIFDLLPERLQEQVRNDSDS